MTLTKAFSGWTTAALLAGLGFSTSALAETEMGVEAHASEPAPAVVNDTAEEHAAKAREWRSRAAHYRTMGGVAFKAGLVGRAEAEARRHEAEAARLRGNVAAAPRSPEAERLSETVERHARLGGMAYKSGLIDKPASELRQLEAPVVPVRDEPMRPWSSDKLPQWFLRR